MSERPQRPPEPGVWRRAKLWVHIKQWVAFADAETKRADEAEAVVRVKSALLAGAQQLITEEAARKIEEWHEDARCLDSAPKCTCLANANLVRKG